MSRIVDFHSHVLPGIDDGSRSVEESITLLRMEAEQGIGHVVATPHFYPHLDTPEQFLKKRNEAEKILREQMQQHAGLPTLSVGAEVYYFHGISSSDGIFELTIDGKRCILIEMPTPPWSDTMYRELEELSSRQGLIPVIAHVDRYIGRFRTYGILDRLAELPVLVQANAAFFLKRSTAPMALRLLKQNKIHLLGSDCHDLQSRTPNLGKALDLIEKRQGTAFVDLICDHQRHALENGKLSACIACCNVRS